MIGAVFRVALLRLLRDRGALVMTFVLPSAIFVIFAAIFGGSAGGDVSVRVAIFDQVADETSGRLIEALGTASGIVVRIEADADAIRSAVVDGSADAGLVVASPLTGGDGPPLQVSFTDANRLPGAMLIGRIQAQLAEDMPDVVLRRQVIALDPVIGPLDPAQQARLDQTIAVLAESDEAPSGLVETEIIRVTQGPSDATAYYAGAIAILFLLFSSVQGAVAVVEERLSGVRARLALSSGGAGVLIGGRFVFLTLQGAVQALVIFLVAWIFYGLDWLGAAPAWIVTTLLAAAAATGLALALSALSASREQAVAVSNFTVLILSAVGGSMAPRFLMPDWLRDLGWLTPNAWAIEAYNGTLRQGETTFGMLDAWLGLAVFAIIGLGIAIVAEGRRMRA